MEKGIFGRIYEKKRSFIENLVKDVDSRIGVQNYSNEVLKSFVENNYKVSFNFKIGKKYINENDFESIATSYRDNKRNEAYKEITSMINDVKEKKRQEAYIEIKEMLAEKFKELETKKIESLKEKIKLGESITYNDAKLLSKNKTFIGAYQGRVNAVESYFAIHPKLVSENITPYQGVVIGKKYKQQETEEAKTGIKRVIIKNSELEGHLLGIDTQGAIREGADMNPENFVDTLVLNIEDVFKYKNSMCLSDMISQTINSAAGNNIKTMGNYSYFLLN